MSVPDDGLFQKRVMRIKLDIYYWTKSVRMVQNVKHMLMKECHCTNLCEKNVKLRLFFIINESHETCKLIHIKLFSFLMLSLN